MKTTYLALILFFSSISLFGQSDTHFGKQIIAGSAFSYIPNAGFESYEINHIEFTWTNNVSVSLSKRFHVGLEHKMIFAEKSNLGDNPYEDYYMIGAFTQIDILEIKNFRTFGQLGFDFGNYCPCSPQKDPIIQDNTSYISGGLGLNYRISKYFSLDVSSSFSYILKRVDFDPRLYSNFSLGVNYDFIRA